MYVCICYLFKQFFYDNFSVRLLKYIFTNAQHKTFVVEEIKQDLASANL